MTLDASHLEVPDTLDSHELSLAELNGQLADARLQPAEPAVERLLGLLLGLNRSAMTLLERQRALQSITEEYRHYAADAGQTPALLLPLCAELAIGFKQLVLQMLQGRQPSRPHLAWCLYMAQYFLAQTLLRHYQMYQQPPAGLWRDNHLLYWLAEQQQCLDEPVPAAFRPTPATSVRGLYQQMLLVALSDPFRLATGECARLFSALSPLAELVRLNEWHAEDAGEAPCIDLSSAQPYLMPIAPPQGDPVYLRRLELGALQVALHEPAPLQLATEQQLLKRVQAHWLGQQPRRHPRTPLEAECRLVTGLSAIHAHLLTPTQPEMRAQMLDTSPGGARLLGPAKDAEALIVGQLLLLLSGSSPILAIIRWRHQNREGLHLGVHYLKGLPRPAWLRRAPSSKAHPGVLQSTPEPGTGWSHGLWIANSEFAAGEQIWLQLPSVRHQAQLTLPAANLGNVLVTRHPLQLA